jgi:Ni,Fe-hydrogenase III large subunit
MTDRPCEVCTFQHQGYFCTEQEKAQEPGCPFGNHIRDVTKKDDEIERLRSALVALKQAVEYTHLGVRGVKAVQQARAALEK